MTKLIRSPRTITMLVLAFALVAAACGEDTDSTEPAEIDPILTTAITGGITLGDEPAVAFDEIGFEPEFQHSTGTSTALLAVWNEENFLIVPAGENGSSPTGEVLLIIDEMAWTAEGVDFSGDDLITASGEVVSESGDETLTFSFEIPFGVGSSTFEIVGTEAIVRGDLGSRTFEQVEVLIENHPEVETLVLQDISGSVNDAVNVETARLVRNAGLNTHVAVDGQIFSGGVDLFAAGVERTVDAGGVLGVHSWCCGPNGESADELPMDSPAHDSTLGYLIEMLGEDAGREFYFFTLSAAPFDGMHEMTTEELSKYLLTD